MLKKLDISQFLTIILLFIKKSGDRKTFADAITANLMTEKIWLDTIAQDLKYFQFSIISL
jgi:hypothetical protein